MQHESNEELKREIERTPARVAADVDALSEKVSPEHLKQQAKQSIQQAKEQMKERVKYEAGRARENLFGSARIYPVPLLLFGAVIGWLILDTRKRYRSGWVEPSYQSGYQPAYEPGYQPGIEAGYGVGYEPGIEGERAGGDRSRIARGRERIAQIGERVTHAREHASERLHDARQHASERMHHVRDNAETFLRDNPLAAGAIALGVGVGVGMLIPTTNREGRVLGPQKERLMQRGREKVSELGEVAEHAVREAKRVAKDELGKGNTLPGGTEAPRQPDGGEFDSTIEQGSSFDQGSPFDRNRM